MCSSGGNLFELTDAISNKSLPSELINYPFAQMNGETPLIVAVKNKNEQAVQWLLNAGADLYVSDEALKFIIIQPLGFDY